VRGATGTGDDHLEAVGTGVGGKVIKPGRGAMGGDDARLVLDLERVERFGGVAQRRPVGLAPHDDGDRRRIQHWLCPRELAKEGV
jgi:hypothetical protein